MIDNIPLEDPTYDCPVCGGNDCSGANPQPMNCPRGVYPAKIMQMPLMTDAEANKFAELVRFYGLHSNRKPICRTAHKYNDNHICVNCGKVKP